MVTPEAVLAGVTVALFVAMRVDYHRRVRRLRVERDIADGGRAALPWDIARLEEDLRKMDEDG